MPWRLYPSGLVNSHRRILWTRRRERTTLEDKEERINAHRLDLVEELVNLCTGGGRVDNEGGGSSGEVERGVEVTAVGKPDDSAIRRSPPYYYADVSDFFPAEGITVGEGPTFKERLTRVSSGVFLAIIVGIGCFEHAERFGMYASLHRLVLQRNAFLLM